MQEQKPPWLQIRKNRNSCAFELWDEVGPIWHYFSVLTCSLAPCHKALSPKPMLFFEDTLTFLKTFSDGDLIASLGNLV